VTVDTSVRHRVLFVAALAGSLIGPAVFGVVGGSSVTNAQGSNAQGSTAQAPQNSCSIDRSVSEFVRAKNNEELAQAMFIVHVYGFGANSVTSAQRGANEALFGEPTPGAVVATWKPAGVILIQRNSQDPARALLTTGNVVSGPQLRRFTRDLRRSSADPNLLVSIDQEGGRVNRLRTIFGSVPSAAVIGATEAATRVTFDKIATNLASLGINMDFAPVADVVLSDTARTGIIGDRSFGSDPSVVANRVAIAVAALQQRGIAAVAKHWPGHGSTSIDSHEETPVLDYSRSDVVERNLRPFVSASGESVSAIMVGHLAVPSWDVSNRPATISRPILERLRSTFCGVIITDSLWMGGVRRFGSDASIVRDAVYAGVDLLLMPVDLRASVAMLAAEAQRDPVFRARLIDANMRVETLRRRFAPR
jgi:beta-N-acetylhexosaminidase